jgi:glycolate oxidase FAD binding subunit
MAVAASDEGAPDRLRATAAVEGGYATLMRASEEKRRRVVIFQPEQARRAALTKTVKAAFDPFGLCNPGRMNEGV